MRGWFYKKVQNQLAKNRFKNLKITPIRPQTPYKMAVDEEILRKSKIFSKVYLMTFQTHFESCLNDT